MAWNSNGWFGPNQPARESILEGLEADIVFVSETKTTKDDRIIIHGYKTVPQNRFSLHKNATSGSGGVAFLFSENICQDFSISTVDAETEGILAVRLKHNN